MSADSRAAAIGFKPTGDHEFWPPEKGSKTAKGQGK